MQTHFLFDALRGFAPYEQIVKESAGAHAVIAASGLAGAQKAHLACALSEHTGRPLLFLCDSERSAAQTMEDLSELLGGGVCLFPAREITFYQDVAASREVAYRRIETLRRLVSGEARAVVAPADALLHRVMPRAVFSAHTLSLRVGEQMPTDELLGRLLAAGYTREYMVEGKGQFSVRGGIVDIYPADAPSALRVEFFDDEIDSIRQFDVMSQRSQNNLQQAAIPPATEAPALQEGAQSLAQELLRALARQEEALRAGGERADGEATLADLPLEDGEIAAPAAFTRENRTMERFGENVRAAVSQMQSGISSRLLEKFIHMAFDQTETILDYMTRPLIVLDEPEALFARMDSRTGEFAQAFTAALERGEALPQQENLMLTRDQVLTALHEHTIMALTAILRPVKMLRPTLLAEMGGMGAGSYGGRTQDMCQDIARWMADGWRVMVLSGGAARGERMRQSFEDEGIRAPFDELGASMPDEGECHIYPLTLSSGFQYPQIRLAVIACGDVYGAKGSKGRQKKRQGAKIASFTDLNVGDYVVHETHGIGIYQGTKRLTSEGASRDYLLVQYLGSDKLYIPVDHLDRIQKYIGSGEGAPPKLSRLGGKDWDKQKSKVRESLKALAFDLVKLYAERQKNRGHAFAPDSLWQQEFEENFPYEETPDQLQATEEIKRDMERDVPMDRLLCGDVGYGKTEVALRAAFKAVMDGMQVAILAPTTILAQQHYGTLMRRFEGFPVRADVLSRFRTAREQKKTLEGLASGEIDIVVGTHRLLAKDVKFKNLGLLIVDEEQRFGVGHKETIKNMKKSVDVLTMSATPIPRTLHMSMVGIRDMSLLETPPQARYPVQTYVMEYQDSVIRDAILRELGRGGQVFFLYNRVGSIEQCYRQLSKLVPEARIAIAHGQMRENVLEDVMLDFSQQKYDVLLCTTIIESGLDIPMANTLIIYDADHFGLGQLYQMRGRVGRSNRLAYAYFTVRPGKVLSETAQKRLDAIREFTEFGSGFRIAMRDLELRGAGNLLGPQQSGHLANIGYDLYCKLLEEAVLEAQGEAPRPNRDVETRMEVHVNAYLPAEYVTGDRQRLEVYKRIASITTAQQRDDVEEELIDRFGDEPQCVANLVAVAYLKAMCAHLGIDRVTQANGRMDMRFAPDAQVDGERLFKALQNFDRRLTLNAARPVTLSMRDDTLAREDMLHLTTKAMERLLARMQAQSA
ncbi:MAG TPA: transcription-repair coupling factor [Candidatus Ventricola intestinavium]|nr:transcription-repair coupling factor [Candidatus Ventricola intestinavium]